MRRLRRPVHNTAHRTPPARGFTLIEVMIAVLILGLALLGLGAVFPVALRAQRQSADDTLGIGAVNAARAFLNNYNFKSAMEPWTTTPSVNAPYDARNFWRDWRDEDLDVMGLNHRSPSTQSPSDDDSGYWVVPPIIPNSFSVAQYGVPARTPLRPQSSRVELPLRERLFPLPTPRTYPEGQVDDPGPQFVWDIAIHRSPDFDGSTNASQDDLEVAVFVRRIDQRIQVPAGYTLYQVLTGERSGGVSAGDRRVPVGIASSGPNAELPTGDGTGKYGAPMTVDVDFRYDPPGEPQRDRLYILDSDHKWELAHQPGQKLVDNLGQVHTVRSYVEEGGDRYVILEAPVRVQPNSAGLVQQVVFTPQVPASVFVVKVKP